MALFIALFVCADWYYYYRTRESLDSEFGQRLKALAELASSEVAAGGPAVWEALPAPDIRDSIVSRLERLREKNSIFNVLVVREDGTTLLSLESGLYVAGEPYPHWNMDYPAIINALEGTPAATRLYRSPDGEYLKAGYAPLPLGDPRAGATVVVEANPRFLEGLGTLRTILFAVTGVSVLGILIFASFVFRATSSLVRARESLAQSETLASMGRMAAGIAHEIRNPLFIIRGAAEKLRSSHPENAREIDDFIIEETDRLNGILTDYLQFAKDQPGRRQSFDLAVSLQRSIRQIRESAEHRHVDIEQRYEIGEAPFVGEEKKIRQALINVLLNAEQSIAGEGRVAVTLRAGGPRYEIAVEDTGAGIAERDIGRVFEPFFTTKASGSGLGLFITKRIIEEHGGSIEVTSDPGRGTKVTIFLPAAARSRGAGTAGQAMEHGA